MIWSRRHTLIAGSALIVLSNAVALIGVAYNRSGEPESRLNLTQRELSEDYRFDRDKDDSGLALNLRWRVLTAGSNDGYDFGSYGAAEWLSKAKLEALGFDLADVPLAGDYSRTGSRQLPREMFLILELDGPAYQLALQRAQEVAEKAAKADQQKAAVERLTREQTSSSRLFVVNAGNDMATLREQYPDRERYAIVRGSMRLQWSNSRKGQGRWEGHISDIANDRVYVPLEFQKVIQRMPTGSSYDAISAPFHATVAFGRRLEPWIVAASAGKP